MGNLYYFDLHTKKCVTVSKEQWRDTKVLISNGKIAYAIRGDTLYRIVIKNQTNQDIEVQKAFSDATLGKVAHACFVDGSDDELYIALQFGEVYSLNVPQQSYKLVNTSYNSRKAKQMVFFKGLLYFLEDYIMSLDPSTGEFTQSSKENDWNKMRDVVVVHNRIYMASGYSGKIYEWDPIGKWNRVVSAADWKQCVGLAHIGNHLYTIGANICCIDLPSEKSQEITSNSYWSTSKTCVALGNGLLVPSKTLFNY